MVAATPASMRESVVERALVQGVERKGGEVRKLSWIGRRHAPDRLILWFGAHDLAELKAPGKKARAGQAREHARLRAAGFSVYVLDTVDKVRQYLGSQREG